MRPSSIFRGYLIPFLGLLSLSSASTAQNASTSVEVPNWALPGSAAHHQVPPPDDFHRITRTDFVPIGLFDGQSDVGSALVAGKADYNAATQQYSIISAGYNIWYGRDEFRFLWKKMSGDISLAADVNFPDTAGYNDRKAVLVIRQSLDDDAKEAVVALHGAGLMHLAWRPGKGQSMKEMRVNHRNGNTFPDTLDLGVAKRIGLEKKGDAFTVYISMKGEPMHPFGAPVTLAIDGPFYVGVGFCSHLPATLDTAVLSHVILDNTAGRVR